MGETTSISWTDHTFNPWMGCTNVSPGCDHCYAEALGKRTGRVQWGDDAKRIVTSDAYWRNPIKWNATAEAHGVRHRVFCASLADVFEDRDELHDTRQRLLEELIPETPWLDWQLLTKRPQNVLDMVPEDWLTDRSVEEWAGWPDNVWIGTTVEDQEHADERIPHLLKIPAPVRFLSCEPLLGPIRLGRYIQRVVTSLSWAGDGWATHAEEPCPIHWVIVGGESGPGYRPFEPEYARSLQFQCAVVGIPFFFKQHGGRFPTSGGDQLDGQTYKAFPRPAVHA